MRAHLFFSIIVAIQLAESCRNGNTRTVSLLCDSHRRSLLRLLKFYKEIRSDTDAETAAENSTDRSMVDAIEGTTETSELNETLGDNDEGPKFPLTLDFITSHKVEHNPNNRDKDFPWFVAIGHPKSDKCGSEEECDPSEYEFDCTGVMVSRRQVLSIVDCFKDGGVIAHMFIRLKWESKHPENKITMYNKISGFHFSEGKKHNLIVLHLRKHVHFPQIFKPVPIAYDRGELATHRVYEVFADRQMNQRIRTTVIAEKGQCESLFNCEHQYIESSWEETMCGVSEITYSHCENRYGGAVIDYRNGEAKLVALIKALPHCYSLAHAYINLTIYEKGLKRVMIDF